MRKKNFTISPKRLLRQAEQRQRTAEAAVHGPTRSDPRLDTYDNGSGTFGNRMVKIRAK